MVSSSSRKERRKRLNDDHEERSGGQDDSHTKKFKSGRKEMRTVLRTARRKQQNETAETSADLDDNVSETAELVSDDSDNDGEEDGKAYNALLTLLKSDHPDSKPKAKNSVKKQTQQDDNDEDDDEDEEEDEGHIEGADVEDEKFEAEEALSAEELDDADDEKNDDEFDSQYNQEYERIDFEKKLTNVKKQKYSDVLYTSLIQAPENHEVIRKQSLSEYNVKKRALDPFNRAYPELSSMDKILIDPIFQYKDVNFPYHEYNNDSYKKLYCLHVINHVYKTRDRILKNNEKIRHIQDMVASGKLTLTEEPEFRDQGFTRPKVLILLPTRNSCYEVAELLIKLSGCDQVENKKKFTKKFFDDSEPPSNKPEDFQYTFRGNNNDFFCLGLKFNRKSIKLYSSFYSSDVILASPIGLAKILSNKKEPADFLSSIEVLIVDQANSLEMQNWDHVLTVLKSINNIPKESHGADFSRIRMWSIDDKAKHFKQTLVFSQYSTPNINNLVSRSVNLSGKWKFKPTFDKDHCAMKSIGLRIKQIYTKYDSDSPLNDPDARFKMFTNSVLPSVTNTASYKNGLLIYIPSYANYIRIKNHLSSSKILFGAIDEYSSQSELTSNRELFKHGKIQVLLYTERLHYYRRFQISGVKNILMYSPPINPLFYNELILKNIGKSVANGEADINLSFVRVMFSKWDATSLERIIGTERTSILCNGTNEMFEFR